MVLVIRKDKFYSMVNTVDISQPIQLTDKELASIHPMFKIKLKSIKRNLI